MGLGGGLPDEGVTTHCGEWVPVPSSYRRGALCRTRVTGVGLSSTLQDRATSDATI
jgi:hypothetical protein